MSDNPDHPLNRYHPKHRHDDEEYDEEIWTDEEEEEAKRKVTSAIHIIRYQQV